MAEYRVDDGGGYDGGYARPRAPQTPYDRPGVETSETPTQQWEQPSTPAPPTGYQPQPNGQQYTDPYGQTYGNQGGTYQPPPNAGSWNAYYQQPGTTQSRYTSQRQYPQNGYQPYGGYQQGGYQQGGYQGGYQQGGSSPARTQFTQVASRYAPTPEGFQQLVNDPQFAALGMQSVGNGYVRLPTGEMVNALQPSANGGAYYQYPPPQPQGNADPLSAVQAAFAAKGLTPRDEDLAYWTRRIGETGNWNDPQHQQYWLDRMAMQYGGVGDYSESGKVGYDNNYRMEPGYNAAWDAANGYGQQAGGDPWAQVQQQYMQQQQAYAMQQQQQQAWQQYMMEQQFAQQQAWQQYMMSQPMLQPQVEPNAYEPATGYYAPPQPLPASPDYGGYGYNAGVGLQGGGGSPYVAPRTQAFNYLAQGMPSPYFYG